MSVEERCQREPATNDSEGGGPAAVKGREAKFCHQRRESAKEWSVKQLHVDGAIAGVCDDSSCLASCAAFLLISHLFLHIFEAPELCPLSLPILQSH